MSKLSSVAALSTLFAGAVFALSAQACPDMAQAKETLPSVAAAKPAPQHSTPVKAAVAHKADHKAAKKDESAQIALQAEALAPRRQ